jgi:Fe-S-cluster containining protein
MAKTSICAVCAQNGPTCCQLRQEYADLSFPLSRVEKETIAAYERWKEVCFTVQAANSVQLISRLKFLFPDDLDTIKTLFPENGRHERLLTNKLGYCVFLGPMGCLLPGNARPLYCRLFPFWVIGGRVAFFPFDLCQAQKATRSVKKSMMRLEVNTARTLSLYNALRRAWLLDE